MTTKTLDDLLTHLEVSDKFRQQFESLDEQQHREENFSFEQHKSEIADFWACENYYPVSTELLENLWDFMGGLQVFINAITPYAATQDCSFNSINTNSQKEVFFIANKANIISYLDDYVDDYYVKVNDRFDVVLHDLSLKGIELSKKQVQKAMENPRDANRAVVVNIIIDELCSLIVNNYAFHLSL